MLYELRMYDITPAMMDQYLDWANNQALPLLIDKFKLDVVGFWRQTDIPPEIERGTPTNVVWMIRWPSREKRNETWKYIRSHPEWKAIRDHAPPYWNKIDSQLMEPVPRSPMQ
jgi:hypothetical protein